MTRLTTALPATLVLAAALALAPLGAGQAVAASGASTIELGGSGLAGLRDQGVALGARRPARIARGVLRLPVARGLVRSSAYLDHSGSLRLRKRAGGRTRTLTIRRLQVRLGGRSRVIGTVAGERFALFVIHAKRGTLSLSRTVGSASLRAAELRLSGKAARLVKRRLQLRAAPRGRFGSLTVDALVGGSGGPGGDTGGGANPGGGPPQSGPIGEGPAPPTRPASAVDVSAATLTWHLRDSWIRYVSTEEPPAALEGAVPAAAIPQSAHPCPDNPAAAPPGPLVYSWSLPFVSGWYDAASGTAALSFTGGVRFRYLGHGIDLDVKDLELQLGGDSSKALARFDGRGGTNIGNRRGVLVDLAPPSPPPGGPDTLIRGSIPAGGSESVFAGFYGAGDGFGCVSLSYSVP
jgi:hypothetical protein